MTFYSTILQFGASAATVVYGFHTAINNVGAYQGTFFQCVLAQQVRSGYSEINVSRLSMAHCVFEGLVIKQQNMLYIFVRDSYLEAFLESSVNLDSVKVINSEVKFENVAEGSSTITIGTFYVNPDAVCSFAEGALLSVTIKDLRLHYVMYSKDGGQTMSRSSVGATHYGILKYLNFEQTYSPDRYMWIPMNI